MFLQQNGVTVANLLKVLGIHVSTAHMQHGATNVTHQTIWRWGVLSAQFALCRYTPAVALPNVHEYRTNDAIPHTMASSQASHPAFVRYQT